MTRFAYAIGDIHGSARLLRELLRQISEHAAGQAYDLIFLGDYIDKGPDTAGVLETVMGLTATHTNGGRLVFIKGNHEADLLAAVSNDDGAREKWLGMGGDGVLREYGVPSPDRLPSDVLAWISNLVLFHEDARHYFVHAGLDPAFPRDRQNDRTRMTMRGDFLARDHNFGRHILHGHTPQLSGKPDRRPFRTNIDTAAFMTGVLTAAVLSSDADRPVAFLQTGERR